MPCRDNWDDVTRVTKRFGLDIHDFEAVLCGLFTELEADGELGLWMGDIDWKEVGVSRKMVEAWWAGHKREDARRRKAEAEKKRKEEIRDKALSKLTPEERSVLGI